MPVAKSILITLDIGRSKVSKINFRNSAVYYWGHLIFDSKSDDFSNL